MFIIRGDCNEVLPNRVFPKIPWEEYRRGLCFLDPYGLHLDWHVVETAGRIRTIDLFLNFPVMDINRNALWRDPSAVNPEQGARMTSFWGDGSWRQQAYRPGCQRGLFGDKPEKVENADVAETYRQRLQSVAGFAHVPAPMPMRNSIGAIVYYLFFASQKGDAEEIARAIFNKYARYGV